MRNLRTLPSCTGCAKRPSCPMVCTLDQDIIAAADHLYSHFRPTQTADLTMRRLNLSGPTSFYPDECARIAQVTSSVRARPLFGGRLRNRFAQLPLSDDRGSDSHDFTTRKTNSVPTIRQEFDSIAPKLRSAQRAVPGLAHHLENRRCVLITFQRTSRCHENSLRYGWV